MPSNNPTANLNSKLRNNPYSAPQYYYPSDLGSEGNEPYVIFDIRDGVAKDAKSKGTIALYMPPEIKSSYRATYEETQMGILGANPSFNSMPGWQSIKSGLYDFSRNPIDSIKKGFDVSASQGAIAAQATALNASARLQRDLGKVVNPHMAVLFQGMGFRVFSLNFSMVARSAQESDMIRNIIYTFKYHMHPSLPPDNTQRFLLYPENFVIGFYSPATDYLFKVSPCVLEGMDVDYAGSGVPAFFSDTGAPVHITMSLQFKEMEALTKERIAQGL